jgi:hypothetical protein
MDHSAPAQLFNEIHVQVFCKSMKKGEKKKGEEVSGSFLP